MKFSGPITPAQELQERTRRLQHSLTQEGLDGALILQNSDLFYFAGTIQQAHLYIPCEGPPLLMARKSLPRAQAESGLEQIVALKSAKQLPGLLQSHGYKPPDRLGLELDVLPANLYLGYQRIFDKAALVDCSHLIRMVRAVKSPYEISIIREAGVRADQVAAAMKPLIRPGMTEVELAGRIEAEARRLGHQGVVRMRLWGAEMFYGHLMAGPSAAVPSYLASPTGGTGVSAAVAQGPGFGTIRAHEPILFDYVFAYQGYIADHTRIFAVDGLPDELLRAHAAMLAVQETVKAAATPGTAAGAVYDLAIERAAALGYAENFMGADDQRIRFIGHGVGIELDEYPFLAKGQRLALQEGMIVALEPKLIFPGKGVVGIENTHLVTSRGLEPLTCFEEQVVIV